MADRPSFTGSNTLQAFRANPAAQTALSFYQCLFLTQGEIHLFEVINSLIRKQTANFYPFMPAGLSKPEFFFNLILTKRSWRCQVRFFDALFTAQKSIHTAGYVM